MANITKLPPDLLNCMNQSGVVIGIMQNNTQLATFSANIAVYSSSNDKQPYNFDQLLQEFTDRILVKENDSQVELVIPNPYTHAEAELEIVEYANQWIVGKKQTVTTDDNQVAITILPQ